MPTVTSIDSEQLAREHNIAEQYRKHSNADVLVKQTRRGNCIICGLYKQSESVAATNPHKEYAVAAKTPNPHKLLLQDNLIVCRGCVQACAKALGFPTTNAHDKLKRKSAALREEVAELKAQVEALKKIESVVELVEAAK